MIILIAILIKIALLYIFLLSVGVRDIYVKGNEDNIEIYEIPDPTDKQQPRQVYGSDFSGYWSNRNTYHYW